MVFGVLNKGVRKVVGSRNDRLIKAYRRRVEKVNAFEPQIRKLTDSELLAKTEEFRQRLKGGESVESVMFEAFAVAREALDRNVGIRNIFNPEHKFDPSKLSSEAQALYAQTQEAIEQIQPIQVPGQEEPVPGWRQVDIPVALYEAVRALYPESRPPFRARSFDVQLTGAMVLYEGKIAEMKTGEGKTIVAPLACYMAALEGMQCHVVTVNDYLVQRDRDWVFPMFFKLGMHVGAIHPFHMQPPQMKQQAYTCDVVYGTNSEFGFDYLRDNMKLSVREQVQKHRDFCIVDEIDSILIDEARTPLIISGPAREDAPQYMQANDVAEKLVALQKQANQDTLRRMGQGNFVADMARRARVGESAVETIMNKFRDLGPNFVDEKEAEQIGHTQYYVVKPEQKQASMTPLGVEEAQKIVGTRFYVVGNDMSWDHLINQAVRAHVVYEKDREYVVQNGEVVIVDEFTGRLMIGRQWSDGLHQAVEAKEVKHGVKIKKETQTLATITIQNFFKLYKRLAGMTGTAITEATEFNEIYALDAVVVPTNLPVIREDRDDLVFLTEKAKWNAIIEEIREKSEAGRPVLVGTTSVDKSELLSQLLMKKYGMEHEVLNAKNHEREAHIVAKAGQLRDDRRGKKVGNVTIATNMAGRGTDIKLTDEVRGNGGLHIVGTERHESRRIDNQLRGRSGRQGDPGSSRFFISMEDDLMKMFAGKSTMKALSMLGMQENDAIEHRWITRSVEKAQRKVEERNYEIRKNLLEYDEVMEHQRNTFYGTRQVVLEGRDVGRKVFDYIAQAIEDAVDRFVNRDYVSGQMAEAIRSIFGVWVEPKKLRGRDLEDVELMVRNNAMAEARQEIENVLGEFMSPDMDPRDWDVKELAAWAKNRYGAELKASDLKDLQPDEAQQKLEAAVHERIEHKPLKGLERFLDEEYTAKELAAWAEHKFRLKLEIAQLKVGDRERFEEAQQRIAEAIFAKAREAYERRGITYPVQFVLDTAFGMAQQGQDAGAWAADQLAKWANARFELGWTAEEVAKRTGDQLFEELVRANEAWHGPQLEAWVDRLLSETKGDDEAMRARYLERWRLTLSDEDLASEDRRQLLIDRARQVLRAELTQLEQFVLLQILDQTWKDHLYGMDQLKDAIGLRGYAERDPKIEYKAEGSRLFQEMLTSVRDKVTDLIFKARLTPNVQMRSAYREERAEHAEAQGTGVKESPASQGTAEQRADLEAAERAGSERQTVQTIVKHGPQVGRNDPCPCGSGKKYKKCCGQAA